jgi:hypothetical protein
LKCKFIQNLLTMEIFLFNLKINHKIFTRFEVDFE